MGVTTRPTAAAPPAEQAIRDTLVERAAVPRHAPLYHLAALVLTAGARAAFDVRALGADRLRLEPSTLLVANHPHEADPAVAVAALYPALYRPWRRELLVHFTLRDDLYARGFFAGYPLQMPLWARRLLFPLSLRRVFDGPLPCPALRSAGRMLVADLVRAYPQADLDELLPQEMVERLRRRAAEQGLRAPERGCDVDRSVYADLLWWVVRRDDAAGSLAEEAFADRAVAARNDFRRFVDIIRTGGVLLISPEGRSSPDGGLQPLKPGVGALLRVGRPHRVQPIGIAYDPLVAGRTLAYVGVGAAVAPRRDADRQVRELLAGAVPLTVGQVVADAVDRRATARLDTLLAEAVDRALATGRPVEPALRDPAVRARRLGAALAAARAHPERLPRLAAAYRTARD